GEWRVVLEFITESEIQRGGCERVGEVFLIQDGIEDNLTRIDSGADFPVAENHLRSCLDGTRRNSNPGSIAREYDERRRTLHDGSHVEPRGFLGAVDQPSIDQRRLFVPSVIA